MTQSEIRERLRAYIVENFLYTQHAPVLGDDEHLLERGIIDSMGVLEMVAFLESEFGVLVHDHEITEQNMRSVASLARYVGEKRDAKKTA